jgi:hypothetical protein
VPALTVAASRLFVTVRPGALTMKHSAFGFVVDVFVCSPGEFGDDPVGVYSTRKQYVPATSAVKASDVAVPVVPVPGESVFVVPTPLPAELQSGGDPDGPHTKKFTVPAKGLAPRVRLVESVTELPREMGVSLTCVVIAGGGGTAAAERPRSWFPPPPSMSTSLV